MIKTALFSLTLLAAAAAHAGPPSAKDLRSALDVATKASFSERVKLLSVEKTNGMKRDLGGTPGYVVDYVAKFEFTQACNHVTLARWGAPDPLDCSRGRNLDGLDQYAKSFAGSLPRSIPDGRYGKEQNVEVKGTAFFVETDKGWRAVH